ncbi:hypothetical protein ED312_06540 [Sinomicrobium pectinilyticum]|uniref:Uncharacterized protein n=1 Tax=Sinomicrobium pectinilyticum TaxID=1084421 RepID=A0A3N0ERC6_SINP1|nr:DUF6520 family protein [Sinomicrobium pectinilyticum]RNL90324.1 hypothetical protein ED312_06540 [Sinomicrobium pectinilyticum]
MKTKVLKFGLPLAVFMMAIVFAFATQNNTSLEEDAFITGFVYSPDLSDCIPAPRDCAPTGSFECMHDGKQVYRFKNGTACSIKLFEWPE